MFKIAVMGCGVVGSGVADILLEQGERLSARFAQEVSLAKILDIRDMSDTVYAPYMVKDAEEILQDPEIRVVVVTVGGLDFACELARKALLAGKHVVTSNKEIVAARGRELTRLAFEKGVRFLYEASSGGGIPIIRPLNICLASNEIYEIRGILNGTTNYILTKMQTAGTSFEAALKRAQEKGYAEADPSADVDGYDAARKIAILSSIAYDRFVDYKKVACTGIRNITAEDHYFAEQLGCVIKLIARSAFRDGKVYTSVEPYLLPKSHMLASVSSVYNAVLVKGSYTGDTLFYGQGAGKLATASAILGDIIEILSGADRLRVLPAFTEQEAEIGDVASEKARYLVRFSFRNTPGGEYETTLLQLFRAGQYEIVPQTKSGGIVTDYMTAGELDLAAAQLEKATCLKAENRIRLSD